MADITEIINDPDFKQWMKENPNAAKDYLLKKTSSAPESGKAAVLKGAEVDQRLNDLGKKALGLGTGLATGGGGIGSLLGGVLGYKFPPQNVGDVAGMAAAPLLGGVGSKLVSKLPGNLAKILGQGVAGAASTEGLTALGEGTNRLATAAGLQNTPQGNFTTGDPTIPQGALPLALGSLPPMLGEAFLSRLVRNNPNVKQSQFANSVLGTNLSPGELSKVQMNNPAQTLQDVHKPYIEPFQATQNKIQDLQGQKVAIADKLRQLDVNLANSEIEPTRTQIIAKKALQSKIKEITKNISDLNSQQAENSARIAENRQLATQAGEGNQNEINSINTQLVGEGQSALNAAQANMREQTIKKNTPERLRANDALLEVQLDNNAKRAQALKLKAEQEAQAGVLQNEVQTGQTENAQLGAQKTNLRGELSQAKADMPISEQPLTRKQIKAQQADLRSQSSNLDTTLQSLRESSSHWDAMHEGLRDLATSSPTPEALIENLKKAPASTVAAFRSHLEDTNKSGLKEFQDSMMQDFFQKAYNPKTPQNPLSNAPDLFRTEYNPSKIDAIFGKQEGKTVALRFQSAVNDIAALGNKTPSGLADRFAKYSLYHSMYLVPYKLLSSGMTMNNGLEGVAAGAAAGFTSIAYPKLIDKIVKDPSFGRSFHEWATAPNGSSKAILTNFPRLAAWWKANSEKEEEPEISQNSNQLNNTNPSSLSAAR